jgi:hypothetical protein
MNLRFMDFLLAIIRYYGSVSLTAEYMI